MGFAASVRQNTSRMIARVDYAIQARARKLFTHIVDLTPSPANGAPFSKGLLANQWYVAVNGISDELSSSCSPSGADSISRINSIPVGVWRSADGFVSMANNVDYAFQAEYIGWLPPRWTGRQGPYAMVSSGFAAAGAMKV
jgi:hypothetical protein